jgi:hypothetical protein
MIIQIQNEKEKLMLLDAVRKHAEGHIAKHRANVQVYLTNPAGIGEHSDIIEAIEHELMEMAKYDDQVEMLNKYFSMENIQKNLFE